ncbi:MAG TPA: arginine repressor [Lachnospiraceae bacterium]
MKSSRHEKIIELVRENQIETQEDLAALLQASGYKVTQATVSRDIKDLKLTKVSRDGKRSVYQVLVERKEDEKQNKYTRVLKDAFVSMDIGGNLLVIRTVSGMAMAVGAAVDGLNYTEILGCVAGDDTLMCAVRTQEDALIVMERLKSIIES